MKITPLRALSALLCAPSVLGQVTGTAAKPTATTKDCTASQITSLCDYPTPGAAFAVASDGRPFCWQYCNDHPPCNFVIFLAGNPYTGTGTCWVYPGQDFDASKGSSNCGNPSLFVYDKPVCAGGNPDTTAPGACAATASPSAVASVCGYPEPPDNCFDSCYASEGASDCLSLCAKADSCSYAVFNPHNPDNSPYSSGTCWVYPNGTYNAESAATCSGAPEQYVYKNVCPKPPKPSTSPSAKAGSTGTGTAATAGATGTGAAAKAGTTGTGAAATAGPAGTGIADAMEASTTSSHNLAPTGLSLGHPFAIGMAALVWQGL